MIFVIAPLGERESRRSHVGRVLAHCTGLALAGSLLGAIIGAIASAVPANAALPVALIVQATLLVLVLREFGMLNFRLPSRNWQMPDSWLGLGPLKSSFLFGGTMGLGFVTRAPMGSLHGLGLLDLAWGSLVVGAVFGLLFGLGRGLPVIIAGTQQRRSSTDLLSFSSAFLHRGAEWRLASAVSLALVTGATLITVLGRNWPGH